MQDLEVKDFHETDLDEVARLWHASWIATGLPAGQGWSVEDYRHRLATEGLRDWCIKLACSGSVIVGFLAFDRQKAWLRQLFVDPRVQGSGVGTRLFDEAKREMPGGFWLRTQIDNVVAKGFYERRGMRPDGIKPHERRGGVAAHYRWP